MLAPVGMTRLMLLMWFGIGIGCIWQALIVLILVAIVKLNAILVLSCPKELDKKTKQRTLHISSQRTRGKCSKPPPLFLLNVPVVVPFECWLYDEFACLISLRLWWQF